MVIGRLATAAALLPVVALACHEVWPPRGCDLCTTSAVVVGTVRDSLGAPARFVLPGATVFVDSCTGTRLNLTPTGYGLRTTDETGRYALALRAGLAPFQACIEMTAVLISDTNYGVDTVVAGKRLQFRADYPAGGAHDTLTIDLVLRHR